MASATNTRTGSYPVSWATTDPFANTETVTNHQRQRHDGEDCASESDNSEETVSTVPGSVRSDDDAEMTKFQTHGDDQISGLQEKIKNAAESVTSKFYLNSILATSPAWFFNPTNVRFHVRWKSHEEGQPQLDNSAGDSGRELAFLWHSRDNRKGRQSIVVPRSARMELDHPFERMPLVTSNLKGIGKNILRMFTSFPYWDMAFWSGWSYSVGSVIFVMDGAWSWETVAWPNSALIFAGQEDYAVGLCFFIGALFFQIGATMAYLEAVNDGSFHGSAMRRLLEGREEDQKNMLDEKIHHFISHLKPHQNKSRDEESADALAEGIDTWVGWTTKEREERPGSIYPEKKMPAPRRGGTDLGEVEEGNVSEYSTWRWWPSWHVLRTHHIYEIGYVACATQLFGATIYGICGIVALPGILNTLQEQWQENAAYWIPQIVASCCFVTASILFTLETQEKWYKPELRVLGWWIGAWAIIGSCGFLTCAICGLSDISEYQSDLGSLWGSCCFLISGLLQWYEALNKHPVDELLKEPDNMTTSQGYHI